LNKKRRKKRIVFTWRIDPGVVPTK